MGQDGLCRKQYPSDLTDEQWAIVSSMIPPAKQIPRRGRLRKVDMREVLNTLLYLNRSGCQWDMLPHALLPKSTVYPTLSTPSWEKFDKDGRPQCQTNVGF